MRPFSTPMPEARRESSPARGWRRAGRSAGTAPTLPSTAPRTCARRGGAEVRDQLVERPQRLLFAPALDHLLGDAAELRPRSRCPDNRARSRARADRSVDAIALRPSRRVAHDALDRLGAVASATSCAPACPASSRRPDRSAPTTRFSSSETGAAALAEPSKLTCQLVEEQRRRCATPGSAPRSRLRDGDRVRLRSRSALGPAARTRRKLSIVCGRSSSRISISSGFEIGDGLAVLREIGVDVTRFAPDSETRQRLLRVHARRLLPPSHSPRARKNIFHEHVTPALAGG